MDLIPPRPQITKTTGGPVPEQDTSTVQVESAQRFRRIFELGLIGIAISSPAKQLLEVNDELCNILGYTREELLHIDWPKITHPDDLDLDLANFNRVLTGEIDAYSIDKRFIRKDGQIICATISVNCLRHADGSVHSIVALLQDITERKRTEDLLRQKERELANAQHLAHYGSWSFDVARDLVHWSEELYSIFGVPPSEFAANYHAFLNLVHPDDRELVITTNLMLRAGRRSFDIEYRIIRPDGEVRFIHEIGSGEYDGPGNAIRLFGTAQDITERKQAEQSLRMQARLLESMAEGVDVLDQDGHILYTNPAFDAMFGYDRGELLGRHVSVLNNYSPEENVEVAGQVMAVVADQSVFRGEFQNKKKDETPFVTRAHISSISLGSKTGSIAVREDITERKRVEEAERAQRELALALRDTAEALTATLDLEQVLDRILENVGRVVPSEAAGVMLVEGGLLGRVAKSRGFAGPGPEEEIRTFRFPVLEFDNLRRMQDTHRPDIVSDTLADPDRSMVPNASWVRSHLDAPLIIRDEVIGFLELQSRTPGFFSAEQAENLRAFASQAAVAIDNAQFLENERRRQAELFRSNTLISAFSRVAARLAESLSLDGVLETLGSQLHLLDVQALVTLLDPDRHSLVLRYLSIEPGALKRIERLIGHNLAGWQVPRDRMHWVNQVLMDLQPLFVPDLLLVANGALGLTAPLVDEVFGLAGASKRSTAIILPLAVGGESLGVLILWGQGLKESDIPASSVFANQLAVAIKNANLFAQLQASRTSLHALSQQLVSLQELDRREIARELHDEIGQALTGLKFSLDTSARNAPDDIRVQLAEDQKQLNELINQVRELSLDLRPAMLDDFGLVPTLLWHLQRFTSRTHIFVKFQHHGAEGKRFGPDVEIAAYRIIQEALTNVARHAQVNQANLRLWTTEETVNVQIVDQGQGFDPDLVMAGNATAGLLGMRERAALLGGRLGIDASPGAGACITAELPLAHRLERRNAAR